MDQVDTQDAQGTSILAVDCDIIAEPILQKAKRSPAALAFWLKCNIPIVKLSTSQPQLLPSTKPTRKSPALSGGRGHITYTWGISP